MDKKILAIDTTSKKLEISLFDRGRVSTILLNSDKTHTEVVLYAINSLLSLNSLKISDIDFFSAVTGPGSFTGIRIGISTVKGFCLGKGVPPLGMNSLDLMAIKNMDENFKHIGVVLDARRGEVYFKLYEKRENFIAGIGEYVSATPDRVRDILKGVSDLLVVSDVDCFIGDKFKVAIQNREGLTTVLIDEILKRVEMEEGLKELEIKDGFYIRPSDAIRNRKN